MAIRRIVLGAFTGFSALAASPALAQDGDWTGLYVGGAVGYADAQTDSGETLVFDTDRDGAFDDTVFTSTNTDAFAFGFCSGGATSATPLTACRTTQGNLNLAVRAGYDWQFGQLVVGVVGEAARARIGDDASGFSTTPASYTFTRDLDFTLAARARAGYAVDRYLMYATAGMAWGQLKHSFTTTNTANTFTDSGNDDVMGYQAGVGLDVMWSDNATLGFEYLFTSLTDDEYVVDVGPGTAPATNPFLIANPAGTLIRREADKFDYDTVSLTATWRY